MVYFEKDYFNFRKKYRKSPNAHVNRYPDNAY